MTNLVYTVHPVGWHHWLSRLDLELLNGGFGQGICEWKLHPAFSGDAFYRLHLPVKGVFSLRYLGETVRVEPGKVYLIPAHTPFQFEPESPSDHYWCHFVSQELSTLPAMTQPMALPVTDLPQTVRRWQKLLKAMPKATTLLRDLALREQALRLLAPFLKQALKGLPPPETGEGFDRVLAYVDEHLTERITTDELRQLTNLSRAGFSARFRALFGVAPKQYVIRRRLSAAKELLWRTRQPVKEVAQRCGFEDPFFFSRLFKQYTECTPAEYRRKHLMD